MCVIVCGAAFSALESVSRAQVRDQAYANEVTAAQTAMSRLLHDLRQATTLLDAQPNRIEFLMPSAQVIAGARTLVTLDIRYDCTATDSRTGYTRCARTQATSGTGLPGAAATAASGDIEHVANGSITTYCAGNGAAQAGSVFFYSNPTTANLDSSPPSCDENYENLVRSGRAMCRSWFEFRPAAP